MKIVRRPSALWRRTLLGIVALPPGSDDPLVLAPPGDAVWDALALPITEAELVKNIAERFGEDSVRVAHDLRVMLAELRAAGLLIDAGDPDGACTRDGNS